MTENKETKIDYGIILSVMLLAIISIATIFSTTYLTGNSGISATLMQIIWYVVGTVAIIVIMQFDSEQLWKLAPIAYGVGLFLLVLVLFFYDRSLELSTGAKSWFKLGRLTFQPSEIMKVAFILMLARVVTKHNGDYSTQQAGRKRTAPSLTERALHHTLSVLVSITAPNQTA